ncbi:hypothetical protein FOL47_009157 [Perkinsus chesapeaki]|uniref:Uncharacterized protein n=1 Tax=Perkinsus chesapeaki TaxID=330153 RepID=A0A7J6MSH1_PERCH|nr:hypothetical protein FOL47_009157 [Perkinsus chesapeaki]
MGQRCHIAVVVFIPTFAQIYIFGYDIERFLTLTATHAHLFHTGFGGSSITPSKVDIANEDYITTLSETQRSCGRDSDTSSCQHQSMDSELADEFGLAIEECLEICARWGLDDVTSEAAESDASDEPWVLLSDENENEGFIVVAQEN